MVWQDVFKLIPIQDFENKIEQSDSVTLKIKYMPGVLNLPKYQELREELKEDEAWSELENLDMNGALPPMRYKENKEIIDEIVLAVKTGKLTMKETEIRFVKAGVSEYFSGYGGKVMFVRRHKVD